MAIVTAVVLTWASVRHGFDLRWWSVVGPLVPAVAMIGLGWRVFTAGVTGANIDVGMFAFFIGPVIAALLTWAVFRSVALLK